MEAVDEVFGFAIMLVGVALVVTAVIRSLRRDWALGAYEIWALPVAGVCLILLGRWLVQ